MTDGEGLFVLFGEVGLIRYDLNGRETWHVPLNWHPPVYGYASSPVFAGDCVVVFNDGENSHHLSAFDKRSGKLCWQDTRQDISGSSYSSPAVGANGAQTIVVVSTSFQALAYEAKTGRRLWWIKGLPFEPKGTPIVADGMAFITYQGLNGGAGYKLPPYPEVLKMDVNQNGALEKEEAKGPFQTQFERLDFNGDGSLTQAEWELTESSDKIGSKFVAVRLGGIGEVSDRIVWTVSRSVPDVPSPALDKGVAYLVRDGGIFTAIDSKTGEITKQGRLDGALDNYYASPVMAGGRVYCASQSGKIAVITAGHQWQLQAVYDLEEEIYATPAPITDGFFVRTTEALYRFGQQPARAK